MPRKQRSWQAASLVISGMVVGVALSAVAGGASSSRPIGGWSEESLAHYVDQRIEHRLRKTGLTEDQLDARINQGILAFIAEQQAQRPDSRTDQVKPIQPDDHVMGDRSARITLIEYSDYECPYCRQFHVTAHRVIEHYQGKVNWVYRHFPLSIHKPDAEIMAVGAECAAELGGNAAFWAYGDQLFQRARSAGDSFSTDELVSLATEIGLDRVRFKRCLDSGKALAAVRADVTEGARAGITGTPASFVRDNATGTVIPMMGAQPYKRFTRVIDQLLARPSEAGSR